MGVLIKNTNFGIVISALSYSKPFGGRKMAGACSGGYTFGFNGQAKDDEVYGEGNAYDFTFRLYDPRTGKFLSVDPLSKEYAFNSPYAFAENSPLENIDLEGLEKYSIHMRAFAPWKVFGGSYHGDDRGFTTAPNSDNVTSRVRMLTKIDTDAKAVIYSKVTSDPSGGNWLLVGPKGEARANPSGYSIGPALSGEKQTYFSKMSGINPLTPVIAPAIDWQSSFEFDKSKMEDGVLSVTAKIRGDGFPSFETFLTDEAGNSVFIAGFAPGSKSELGNLFGNDTYQKVTLDIAVDKKGNFTGVIAGNKTYSLDEWNKSFENQKPAGDIATKATSGIVKSVLNK